jgi:hypothetical protein
MAIPFLKSIQNLGRGQPTNATAHHHLMLSGLSQTAFIKQWGQPDSQIPLKKLGGFHARRSLYLVVRSDDEADYSVWIYRKMDRILFFTKKRLVSHFKWSGFEEKQKRLSNQMNVPTGILPPTFKSITLALVA